MKNTIHICIYLYCYLFIHYHNVDKAPDPVSGLMWQWLRVSNRVLDVERTTQCSCNESCGWFCELVWLCNFPSKLNHLCDKNKIKVLIIDNKTKTFVCLRTTMFCVYTTLDAQIWLNFSLSLAASWCSSTQGKSKLNSGFWRFIIVMQPSILCLRDGERLHTTGRVRINCKSVVGWKCNLFWLTVIYGQKGYTEFPIN